MALSESPAWIEAATAAAVRLAAEAGTEVDDILEHAAGAPRDRLAFQVTRLEQSAELTEVATDLAGLLWAECEEVPLIATILEEPATQAALQAVAEARRQAALRLAEAANLPSRGAPKRTDATVDRFAPVAGEADVDRPTPVAAEVDDDAFPGLTPLPPLTPLSRLERRSRSLWPAAPRPPTATSTPAAASSAPAPAASPPVVPATPATRAARAIPSTANLRPSTGAVLAGTAAAAILLFGRRLRRA